MLSGKDPTIIIIQRKPQQSDDLPMSKYLVKVGMKNAHLTGISGLK